MKKKKTKTKGIEIHVSSYHDRYSCLIYFSQTSEKSVKKKKKKSKSSQKKYKLRDVLP